MASQTPGKGMPEPMSHFWVLKSCSDAKEGMNEVWMWQNPRHKPGCSPGCSLVLPLTSEETKGKCKGLPKKMAPLSLAKPEKSGREFGS